MATYIALMNFTDQGVRNVKDTTSRADAAKEAAKKFGVNMTNIYWTLGQYDLVALLEAKNDESVTAFGLALCTAGNLHLQTLRAFSKEEMDGILGMMA